MMKKTTKIQLMNLKNSYLLFKVEKIHIISRRKTNIQLTFKLKFNILNGQVYHIHHTPSAIYL